jgi:hypothetical protein
MEAEMIRDAALSASADCSRRRSAGRACFLQPDGIWDNP